MRTLCFVVLFGLGAPALAQEAQAPSQPAANADEVVVEGRKPENVYDRFNALNSNDEFDIHCFKQAPTGSNIPLRRCAPNFVVEAEAQAAQNTMVGARGRADARTHGDTTVLEQKSKALTEEIQRLAREDAQLMRDLVRLDELKRQQANDKPARRQAGG